MAEERIATIIKEIDYWKQHKLLPEMYCDYLLALYTNGTGVAEENKVTRKKKVKITMIIQIILQIFLVPFSFLVIYFTEFHPIMQLSILFLFIASSFWQYKFFKKEQNSFLHLSLVVFLLLIFLTTVFISNIYFNNHWITSFLILLQFIIWLVWSQKNRLLYLKIASITGLTFTTFYIVL